MSKDELSGLINEYGKHLYSFCCNLTGNRMEADDLYQDTFLKAVELCHRLDSSGNPKSFIMGISVKIWQNRKRKYAVRQNIIKMEEYDENLIQDVEDMTNQPEAEFIRKELIQAIQDGIRKLPSKHRIVLCMYYTAEMNVEEIGGALHIPKGTVKSRLYKARNMLKAYLEVQMNE